MTAVAEDRYARRVATDAVRIVRTLPGPIDRVWEYLVDGEKRARWLAAGDFAPRVGAKSTLEFRNSDLSPEPGAAPDKYKAVETCASLPAEITRYEPKSVFAMKWGDDDSEVTFELERAGDDVRLTITHARLATRDAMLSVAGGWHTHLDILDDVLAGRTPKNFWTAHTQVEAEYDRML